MTYISHIRQEKDGTQTIQSNDSHCSGVAQRAKQFANEFGLGDFGYAMGMLHDLGKEKHEFQEYIQDVNGIEGHSKWSHEGKSHAYVGGLVAKRILGVFYPLIGNPIMGHHRGLYDYLDLEEIEKNPMPSDVAVPSKDDFPISLPSWFSPSILQPKDFHHVELMMWAANRQ